MEQSEVTTSGESIPDATENSEPTPPRSELSRRVDELVNNSKHTRRLSLSKLGLLEVFTITKKVLFV